MKLRTKILSSNLLFIFLVAIILRLSLVFTAFHGDLNNNISWGKIAYEKGLDGFYGSSNADDWPYSAPNQPPLSILLFTTTTFLWDVLNNFINFLNENIKVFPSQLVWFWEEKGMTFLVKLPSIIADLGIGVLLYRYLIIKSDSKKAFITLLVWLFNPLIIYNSSVWGQTDSVVNFLGLFAIFFLLERKLIAFSIFFILSILFKGSLSIFVPILIYFALSQKYKLVIWIKAFLFSMFVILVTSIWFHPSIDFPLWFINLYKERILPGEIGYLTANAFNFWWLIDNGKIYDSVVYFGFSARVWSLIAIFIGNVVLIFKLSKKRVNDTSLFFSLAVVSLMTFLLLTRIHERYLYPFFPYATLLLFNVPGMIVSYSILSVVHLMNLYNLFWLPDLPILTRGLQETDLPVFLSVVNILLFGYFIYLYLKFNLFQQKEKNLRH